MSRFFLAALIGVTIAATASTSASAYHCLARSPNGASGAAFGALLVRAQNIAMRRCIFVAEISMGPFAISPTAARTSRTSP